MTKFSAVNLTLAGAICMSFVGLLIRIIESADGFQILFYRSIGMSLVILTLVCVRRNQSPFRVLKSLDRNDFFMGICFSLAFLTYVFSMLNTSIESTLFLLSMSPIFAGCIGWFWINEKPHKVVWISMLIALIGVSIMIKDGLADSKSFLKYPCYFFSNIFCIGFGSSKKK